MVAFIGHSVPQAVQVLQLHTLVGNCHSYLQAKEKSPLPPPDS